VACPQAMAALIRQHKTIRIRVLTCKYPQLKLDRFALKLTLLTWVVNRHAVNHL
jgi:hypothetical protein